MEETKIESLKRVTRPGHYVLKIESFTLLSVVLRGTLGIESYESPSFEAGGHKWKLSVYPNGNKKLGGDGGHISLYLVTVDDNIDKVGVEINAMFKLFVMDQLRDAYLTIQDNEVRRFHGAKRKWGFAKFIPHDTFKNAENGYLINDCCVFGVEVLVIPSEVKLGSFSLVKTPIDGTFTWKLDNFSCRKDELYRSEPFTVEGIQWHLQIYPKGKSEYNCKYLSFYLVPHGSSCQSRIFVDCNLIVKDQLEDNHRQVNVKHWFDDGNGCGSPQFMELSDLKDQPKGFLVNDCVVFEVKFNVISKVSDA